MFFRTFLSQSQDDQGLLGKRSMYLFLVPKSCKMYQNLAKCTKILQNSSHILNQKRNFRKIGLRGGYTHYERKKKSTPTSNEAEISNEINDFQTVHEL